MFSTHTIPLIIILKIMHSLSVWKFSLLHSISSMSLKDAFDTSLLYCNFLLPPYIYIYTLLAMNEAYKFCLSALEGILPSHPWQSILTQLQMITLPPFTHRSRLYTYSFPRQSWKNSCSSFMYITFIDGITGQGFFVLLWDNVLHKSMTVAQL